MYHLHGCINTSLCLSLRHTLTCELNIQHNATICQSLLLVGSKTVTTQDHFLSMTTPCHEYQKLQEDGQRPTDIMSCILVFLESLYLITTSIYVFEIYPVVSERII